jgi:spore maturation protein CgeB
VSPTEAAKFYRGARVVINIHRNSWWSHFGSFNKEGLPATHLNPRVWEAGACHTLQICSPRNDLNTYCPEMPTARNAAELEEKVEFYLSNESIREEKAKVIYDRLSPHTYSVRAADIINVLG